MIYWNLMLVYSNGIRQLWPLNMTQHDPRRPAIVDRGKTLQPDFGWTTLWAYSVVTHGHTEFRTQNIN